MGERVLASIPTEEAMLEGSHPSKLDIAAHEPMCARWAEGSLAKAARTGDTALFELAVERFIELLPDNNNGKDSARSLSSTCSTMSTSGTSLCSDDSAKDRAEIVSDIWRAADLDGNGFLSESEARETLRVFLSRPQLREVVAGPLKGAIVKRMTADPRFTEALSEDRPLSHRGTTVDDRLLRLCKHVVSCQCLKIAEQLPHITDAFWRAMDTNGNGQVDRGEFLQSFESSVQTQLVARIRREAEGHVWKMVQGGCYEAESVKEMERMFIEHHNRKRREREVSFELPSATEMASETCASGDCSVM